MIRELPAGFEQRVIAGLDPIRGKAERIDAHSGKPSTKAEQLFALLMNGDWENAGYASQSEADLRLCAMLAEKCGYRRTFVEVIFRHSGLMREKWDERHGEKTYGEATLDKVLDGNETASTVAPDEWQKLFHTQAEVLALPDEVEWVVKRIANKNDIVLVAGLPKCGKSWLFMSLMRALLALPGTKWLEEFEVVPSLRVLYLVPEISLRAAKRRLRKMGLIVHLYDPVTNPEGRLFVHTLTKGGKINLTDEALLTAATGADAFVDPLIRYIEGDENSAAAQRLLSDKLLAIASVARCLFVSHHSPKAFEGVNDITTQNAVRGTGEFGAMASIIFGVLKVDSELTRLHVKCTDARDDDEPLDAFEVQGRPHIDETGDFALTARPGGAAPLSERKGKKNKGGREADPEKPKRIAYLMRVIKEHAHDAVAAPFKSEDLAAMLNLEFNVPEDKAYSAAAVRKLLAEGRATEKRTADEAREHQQKSLEAQKAAISSSPLFVGTEKEGAEK